MAIKNKTLFIRPIPFSFLSLLLSMALLAPSLLVFLLPEYDQPALTAPLVILSVVFTIFWCVPLARSRIDGKIDWFHPSILLVVIYFAYFIFSGVWIWLNHDYRSIWVNLGSRPASVVNSVFVLGVISIFFFGLGLRTRFILPGKSVRKSLNQNPQFSWKLMRYLILVFLVIGSIFKFYHLALYGPLTTDIFRYLSPSARASLGINISQFFLMLESMLDWAALLAIFYFIVRYKETGKKNGWWIILLGVVIITLLDYVVSAKRSGVIPFLLMPLIWYHYIIRRLSISRVVLFFLVGMLVIGGLLMARAVLPLLAQNLAPADYIGRSPSEIFAYYVDNGEWATFDMIASSVVHRDELLKQAGGPILGFLKYSFSTLVVFVPRAIWPGKPIYEDLSQVYYRVLIGGREGIGFSPTIWGTSYLLFHLAGMIIGMYALGWLLRSVYPMFQLHKGRPIDAFLYSVFYWMVFQFVRFGTTGFVILMFLNSMVVGVLAVLLLLRKGRKTAVKFT